jgi:hypothetical protein
VWGLLPAESNGCGIAMLLHSSRTDPTAEKHNSASRTIEFGTEESVPILRQNEL